MKNRLAKPDVIVDDNDEYDGEIDVDDDDDDDDDDKI